MEERIKERVELKEPKTSLVPMKVGVQDFTIKVIWDQIKSMGKLIEEKTNELWFHIVWTILNAKLA